MILQHPLSYFIDLIERNRIPAIMQEFYNKAVDNGFDVPFNKEEEWINDCFENGDDVGFVRLYFKDFLATLLAEQRSITIQQLDFALLDETELKKAKIKVGAYLSSLNALVALARMDSAIMAYPTIIENFQRLQDYLLLKAQSYEVITNTSDKPFVNNRNAPLQWTGTAQAISTLFYKLCYEHWNNGEPLLKFKNKTDIVSLIVDNILEKDGNRFDPDTISSDMKPNKVKTRPVTNIDLDHIIEESVNPSEGTK